MSVVGDIALVVVGVALVLIVIDSAMRTFVLPRGVVVRLTRFVSVRTGTRRGATSRAGA